MVRPTRRIGLLVLAALALHAPGSDAASPPFRVNAAWRRGHPYAVRFDSLEVRGERAAAWAGLDSAIAAAGARHDDALLVPLLVKRGGTHVFREGLAAGDDDLTRALGLARARRDTVGELGALQWRAFGLSALDRRAASAAIWRRMQALALAYGSDSHAGWAEMGLAYLALAEDRTDEARRGYGRAIARLERCHDEVGLRQARIGLARVLDHAGRLDEEIALIRTQLADAHAEGDAYAEAALLNNLGTCEYRLGRLSDAVEDWRQASRQMRAHGRDADADVGPDYDVAIALTVLGRFDEATAQLETSAARARASGRTGDWALAREQLALVLLGEDRNEQAEAVLREVLAHADSLPRVVRDWARYDLARTEYQLERDGAALALCDSVLREPAASANAELRHETLGLRLDVLHELHRDREVLLAAAAARREMSGPGLDRDGRDELEAACARACVALGQPDSALEHMRLSLEYDRARRARDPASDFRERFAIVRAGRSVEYARMILAAPSQGPPEQRRRRAFDALEAATARTLTERLAADPARASAPVTIERLQRDVLRPGELLLELHEERSGSLMVAVTRSVLRFAELPGSRELRTLGDRFLDVIQGDDREASAAAAAGVARTLLAPFSDLIAASRRVLVCADARLLPYAALPAGAGGEPLLASHELAFLPSATLLAAERRVPAHTAPRPLLAVAGGADARGVRLAGAEAEVRWLARRYAGVDARLPGGVRDADALARELPLYQVLHLSGHSELVRQEPWASGIQLGGPADPARWLRASDIVKLRLPARLCVIAGCQSVGVGEPGEGVLGLSTAFLSAGVASVLATLWPVDDAATASLVEDFYRALDAGHDAAAALRAAQDRRRADPATAAPARWAGFVLVGEPSTRVTLRPAAASP